MSNKTIEEAKQHILNQICGNAPLELIKSCAEAYNILTGAEFTELQMKEQGEFMSKLEAETQQQEVAQ